MSIQGAKFCVLDGFFVKILRFLLWTYGRIFEKMRLNVQMSDLDEKA